ncbi:unnamed protein product [Trifolium pratense]|uniref:Uncharacterized protein n=1 Tax=Trifolium pratense TaxID=57577 RepID=A0ACB0KGN0_TRIPR|nr:unnamed protein product [Trifolium pratense]
MVCFFSVFVPQLFSLFRFKFLLLFNNFLFAFLSCYAQEERYIAAYGLGFSIKDNALVLRIFHLSDAFSRSVRFES